jgi:apolipoprotein N-acyltransferase
MNKETISNIVLGITSGILLLDLVLSFVEPHGYQVSFLLRSIAEIFGRLMIWSSIVGVATLIYSLVAVKKSQALTVWLRIAFSVIFLLFVVIWFLVLADTVRVTNKID